MTTVISKRHPGQCTIDAGNKALLRPTDEVKGRLDAKSRIKAPNTACCFGRMAIRISSSVSAGNSTRPIWDMSTNAYHRYYVARRERIVDVRPIMGRSGAAQR
jgi:hypothetical protein